MASISAAAGFDINLSAGGDNMEIGTSPLRQADDIDFEDLDPMQDRSVDNSMLDETEFVARDPDVMQADTEQFHDDDDMLDEEHDNDFQQHAEVDLAMDEQGYAEEEILYDDDVDVPAVIALGTEDSSRVDPNPDVESAVDIQQNEEIEVSDKVTNKNSDKSEEHGQETEQGLGVQEAEVDNRDTRSTVDVIDFAEEETPADATIVFNQDHEVTDQDNMSKLSEHGIVHEDVTATKGDETSHQTSVLADETSTHEEEDLISKNDEIHAEPVDLGPSSTVTDLHPIKIFYLGEEMSLFPPSEQDATSTFFLQDANLADQPIDKLLFSCREVLGDSLDHEDELVLDIPSLGLHISEDSKFAPSLTIVQVVEVYLKLCSNERTDPVEPLYCNLSSRVCLSTQYAYLSNAAHEGKPFSEIAADYIDTPEESGETHQLETDGEDGNRDEVATQISDHVEEEHDAIDHGFEENKLENETDDQQNTTRLESSILEPEHEDHGEQEESSNTLNEQLDSTVAAEEERLDQENILNDIDNDLESEIPLDQADSNRDLIQQETIGDKDHEELPVPERSTNLEATEDTASSHTLEALPGSPEDGDQEAVFDEEQHVIDDHESPAAIAANIDDLDHIEGEDELLPEDDVIEVLDIPAHDASVQHLDQETIVEEDGDDPLLEEDGDSPVDQPENNIAEIDASKQGAQQDTDVLTSTEEQASTAPVTPSKQVKSKRKAPEDEDDLDFLDLSTPEPKRTRPS